MIRTAVVVAAVGFVCLMPRSALAITVDQIVALKQAGVTDTVVLALIDRDRTVYAIEPEQIVSLQRAGLSEAVILAMLKSGRDEGEQAARADSAYNAAWIASNLATEPLSVTVGHGPDRPNTPHVDGFYSGAPLSTFAAPTYYGPAFHYRASAPGTGWSRRSREPKALCYAQISTVLTSSQTRFVTECPDIMQPPRR